MVTIVNEHNDNGNGTTYFSDAVKLITFRSSIGLWLLFMELDMGPMYKYLSRTQVNNIKRNQ